MRSIPGRHDAVLGARAFSKIGSNTRRFPALRIGAHLAPDRIASRRSDIIARPFHEMRRDCPFGRRPGFDGWSRGDAPGGAITPSIGVFNIDARDLARLHGHVERFGAEDFVDEFDFIFALRQTVDLEWNG